MTWCCALWQAVVLEAGEERDAAQQQAADAEDTQAARRALAGTRSELEAIRAESGSSKEAAEATAAAAAAAAEDAAAELADARAEVAPSQVDGAAAVEAELRQSFDAQNASARGFEDLQRKLLEAEAQAQEAVEKSRDSEAQRHEAQARERTLAADCEQLREAQGAMEASLQKASAHAESGLAAVEKEAAETPLEMMTQVDEAQGEIDSVRGALQGMTETAESSEVRFPRAICPCKVVDPIPYRSVCPSRTYSAYVICKASIRREYSLCVQPQD